MGRDRHPAHPPRPRDNLSANTVGRKLTALLRHRVHENGLSDVLRPDGFVPLAAVLQLPQFLGVSVDMVREAVRIDSKQRMSLLESGRTLFVRCNQGHSIGGLDEESMATPLDEVAAGALCGGTGRAVHGTYHKSWPAILASGGLNKMSRTHVHLAQGLPGTDGVISGMRSSSEIVIWVDVVAAIRAGLRFVVSSNGVVLTADDVLVRYFAHVEDTRTGAVWIDGEWRSDRCHASSSTEAVGATPKAADDAAILAACAELETADGSAWWDLPVPALRAALGSRGVACSGRLLKKLKHEQAAAAMALMPAATAAAAASMPAAVVATAASMPPPPPEGAGCAEPEGDESAHQSGMRGGKAKGRRRLQHTYIS